MQQSQVQAASPNDVMAQPYPVAIAQDPVYAAGVPSFHTMADGITLHAQTWRASASIGVVLFLHGWNEMIDSKVSRRLAQALNAKQITLVAYDHDMHGKSMGKYNSLAFCCRGNVYGPGTVGSTHALEMAKVVAAEHKPLPFVLVGHSLGGGTAMLAIEAIDSALRAEGEDLKGAVFLAPGSVDLDDTCRTCCCPLIWIASKVPVCIPGAVDDNYSVPGEQSLAANAQWLSPCCLFCLPEKHGGLPGKSFWSQHNGGIPYTILVGSRDDVVTPKDCTMMRDAAPHGKLEILENAGHELFTDLENWSTWVEKTAAIVQGYHTGTQ